MGTFKTLQQSKEELENQIKILETLVFNIPVNRIVIARNFPIPHIEVYMNEHFRAYIPKSINGYDIKFYNTKKEHSFNIDSDYIDVNQEIIL